MKGDHLFDKDAFGKRVFGSRVFAAFNRWVVAQFATS
jgi:hypothetical protein